MQLLERAKTDQFAFLRLLNLYDMAYAAQNRRDLHALLNFTVEGMPLAFYLNVDLRAIRAARLALELA